MQLHSEPRQEMGSTAYCSLDIRVFGPGALPTGIGHYWTIHRPFWRLLILIPYWR